MAFLQKKRILIVGLASKRSIAWGIASALHREGAELAFTYQNDKLKSRVVEMATELGSTIIMPCDVAIDSEIDAVFNQLGKQWDSLDGIVHSVAYAPADQLKGDYLDCVSREGFGVAHDISSYSLAALAKAGRSMMQGTKGSIITMSYLGSTRSIPNYNTMGLAKASLEANVRYIAQAMGPEGIRVNAISAGPIKTLAAAGIGDFRMMQKRFEETAPLGRNITIEEVGNAAAFLLSDLASGITGEIMHVDAGFSNVGM